MVGIWDTHGLFQKLFDDFELLLLESRKIPLLDSTYSSYVNAGIKACALGFSLFIIRVVGG